jgi:serine/threonine protein kinase
MEQGVLHRDLAARNVLLFSFDEEDPLRTSVKVTDFGLSVGAYSKIHVYGADGECKPVRYLPPETLKKGRYSLSLHSSWHIHAQALVSESYICH